MVKQWKVFCAVMATVFLWSSAFVGIRIGLHDYHPGSMALLRFLVASVCMGIAYFSLPNRNRIEWRDLPALLGLGVLGIGVYNVCLNYGEVHVSAGIASFIIGLIPVVASVLAVFLLHESIGRKQWLGVGISLSGMVMLVIGEGQHHFQYQSVFLIFIACLMGAIYSVVQKHYLKKYHPIEVTAFVIWGGTLLLLFYSQQLIADLPRASLLTTSTVIYMGIFPAAVAYATWSYAVHHMPIAKASLYLYTLPLVSTLLGFIVLQEKPSLISLLGGCVAMLGALWGQKMSPQ